MIDKILDIIKMIISMIKSSKDKKDAEELKTQTQDTRDNCFNYTSSEGVRQVGGIECRNTTTQTSDTTPTSHEHDNN